MQRIIDQLPWKVNLSCRDYAETMIKLPGGSSDLENQLKGDFEEEMEEFEQNYSMISYQTEHSGIVKRWTKALDLKIRKFISKLHNFIFSGRIPPKIFSWLGILYGKLFWMENNGSEVKSLAYQDEIKGDYALRAKV